MFRVSIIARVLLLGGVCSSLLLFAHVAEAALASVNVNKVVKPVVRTLDNSTLVGFDASIAIGSDGNPIIVHHDDSNGDLRLAVCQNKTCSSVSTSTIDSTGFVGQYSSIAIGRDGYPVISYWDNTNKDLKFAKCNNVTCSSPTVSTLESTGNVGEYTSVAIGSDGYPVISYNDATNQNLKMAKCNDTSCSSPTLSTIDPSAGIVGWETSIAIGSDGYPVISYWDLSNNDLKFAKCNDTSCSSPTLSTLDSTGSVGQHNDITIGSDGYPVISYYDFTNDNLKVAKCNDLSCSSPTLSTLDSAGNVGFYTSVKIGRNELPLISYYDLSNGDLKLAVCNNITCSSANLITVVSVGDAGYYTDIAVGNDGYPVIAYQDNGNGTLKFAYVGAQVKVKSSAGSGKAPRPIVLDSSGNTGWTSSIVMGSDGLPIISYNDGTNGDLKLAKCNNTSCTSAATTTLDSTGIVGLYSAIAIGRDGYPVISYSDLTNGDLKFAKCNDAACSAPTISTIDSTGNVGSYGNMVIGRDGYPIIAYYDDTNDDLKFAKCNDAACSAPTISTIDSTGNVGMYAVLGVAIDGNPVIAYSDVTNTNVKLAKCSDYTCSSPTLTVIGTIGIGGIKSMAIGTDGLPIVSYVNAGFNDVVLTKCYNHTCSSATSTTIDPNLSGGSFLAIAIGRDGLPVVTYEDGAGSLRFAKCINNTCNRSNIVTLITSEFTFDLAMTRGIDGYPLITYRDTTNTYLNFLACGSYCGSGVTIGKNQASKVSSGLVGYWSFNGSDFTDKVYDRSGTGNHGYVTGVATSAVKSIGRIGQGIELNGSVGAVNAGNPATLDNISSLSLVGWVKADNLSTNRTIIAKEAVGSIGWTHRSIGEILCFRQYFSGATGIWCEDSKFPVGEWTHIALTYDRSSDANDPIFYVNGVATTSIEFTTPSGSITNDGGSDLLIGSTMNVVVWDGKIDEVRVYNRILTASEIKELYMLGR